MDYVFLIFSANLPWQLTIELPWLERESWVHESPIPVPKQEKESFSGTEKHFSNEKTSSFQNFQRRQDNRVIQI
jgi:ribosomal protein S10